MPVISQLPIQTTKILYNFFDVHLFHPTLKKVPPPMLRGSFIKTWKQLLLRRMHWSWGHGHLCLWVHYKCFFWRKRYDTTRRCSTASQN